MSTNLFSVVLSQHDVLTMAADARKLARAEGLALGEGVALAQVICELGMNALLHGGGGGMVEVDIAASGWSVVVRDSGRGLSEAVLGDDGRPALGSGLSSVRRLASRLELSNPEGGGARVAARRDCQTFESLSDASR